MCQKCIDAAKRHYPDFSDEEVGALLMNATCFPFGSPELVERQIIEVRQNTDGSLQSAIDFAHEELDREMNKFRSQATLLIDS